MTAIAVVLTALSRVAHAGPEGGKVVAGSADISQAGNITNINQSSNRAIINWQGFSVGKQETVNFNQPNSSSVTLNRVIGNETSVISGALNANGRVFIVNSAGVLFSKSSQVNVGGLVASTLDISNSDFMAGRYTFSGNSKASVVNQGNIRAHDGGYVALLGKTVSNDGAIVATLGTVAMSAGEKITLNFGGDSLVNVTIDRGTLNALVENKRAIRADGGRVIMTARAADALLSAQVNNTGIVQARTIAALKGGSAKGGSVKVGTIKIHAYGGTAKVAGTLDASAPNGGDGGFIETSGDKVQIADSALITTIATYGKGGTWLIDPTDFTIAAHGGDITGAALSNQLANNGSVIIEAATMGNRGTNGDIFVNDAVTWSTNSTLTLTAVRDININAPITATGNTAGLVMNFGRNYNIQTLASYSGAVLDRRGEPVTNQAPSGTQYGSVTLSGAGASLTMNGQSYTLIHSMADLAAKMNANPNGLYALAQNLDAGGTTYNGAVVTNFAGTFAGLGHTITNLNIDAPVDGGTTLTGLIGEVLSGSRVRDIGLLNVQIDGRENVGALAGMNRGVISHVYVTGAVTGAVNVGGLVGYNTAGTVTDSYASVAVTGSSDYTAFNFIGGLVGRNFGATATVIRSHATGDVTSEIVTPSNNTNIGGLVGGNQNGTIADSYSQGAVKVSATATSVGGLVGLTGGPTGTIRNSFATGHVTGGYSEVGGLAGQNYAGGRILNSYATGNVTGGPDGTSMHFGGLVGFNNGSTSTISDSHATGSVTVSGHTAGGLVGNNGGTISNSYATGNINGSAISSGMGGLAGSNAGTITGSHATGNVSGETAGGLVGGNTGTIRDSYATGSVRSRIGGGGGLVYVSTGTITNSTYRDVAAERAEAATRTANAISNDAQMSATTPPDTRASRAGTGATSTPTSAAIDDTFRAIEDNARGDDERRERERRRAAAAKKADQKKGPGAGGGFAPTIRSIDVDGQRFDLQNNPAQKSAPGPKGQ